MVRKTSRSAIALVAGLGLLLSACGSSSDAPADSDGTPAESNGDNTQADPEEEVTITYTNFISNGGNEDNLQLIVDAFEADNPNIKVDVKTLAYDEYFTALQTDIAGGTASDLFDIEFANYQGYQENGVLAPLSDVDTSVYQDSLADAYATDGTQYALPSSFSTVVLFYNKDLFDEAGVDYPEAGWTWADEQAAAEKLNDADKGVFGDYQPISYHEFYKTVAQAGGQFLNDDSSAAAFNSPQGVAAAEWLVAKSGSTMPTVEQGAGTPDYDSNLFAEGKLAMWHTGIWMFGDLADVDFDWDIAVEPGDSQQASALFSNGVAVSAGSENIDAAQAFAQFLTSSDVMVDVRLDSGWELPPVSDEDALEPYLTKDNPENRAAVFAAIDEVALAPSIGAHQAEMEDIVSEVLSEAAAGRLSVEDALTQAEEKVNALLS